VHERGIDPPPFLRGIWKRYCALVEQTPPEYRHCRTHEYHYTYLHPGEAELIDADLIRATCLVGSADELIEQIRELERQGLQELMFATGGRMPLGPPLGVLCYNAAGRSLAWRGRNGGHQGRGDRTA